MKPKIVLLVLFMMLFVIVDVHAQLKPSWVFHDELIQGLESPRDTIYVENRKKLEKLTGLRVYADSMEIHCATRSKQNITIILASGSFVAANHKIDLPANLIDNKKCYGIDQKKPKKDIQHLKIKWNNRWLNIPPSAYANLYEPYMSLEAYLSKNKKLLYIYMDGSDGAGSYSVKFVFNRQGYVTRLITTNECTDDFDFLDGTAAPCE